MSRSPIALDADVEAGLRRLRLAAIRREAPEVLATAKAQRWAPEELLRVLVEAEIVSRDASNTRNRMTAARFRPSLATTEDINLAIDTRPMTSRVDGDGARLECVEGGGRDSSASDSARIHWVSRSERFATIGRWERSPSWRFRTHNVRHRSTPLVPPPHSPDTPVGHTASHIVRDRRSDWPQRRPLHERSTERRASRGRE